MRKAYCDFKGCLYLRRYAASGLCSTHERRRRNGIPLDAPHRLKGMAFERNFSKGPGCWEWTGYIDKRTGYGRSKQSWAHRVSYERYVGPIAPGMVIDHLCRNRKCVNPGHLEVVTVRTNTLRGISPSAISVRTNRCKRGHEWTPENTYLRPDGQGRQCRACIHIRIARRGRRSAA